MIVKLWGVRGSLPAPTTNKEYKSKINDILSLAVKGGITSEEGIPAFVDGLPDHLKYLTGGNTTCVEIRNDSGGRLIIDCGSGLRRFGLELLKEAGFDSQHTFHIMMTHTHWDHIMGWPFFVPAYFPQNTINFYSTYDNLHERMERNQHIEHFPLQFDNMASKKHFHELKFGIENTAEIDGFKVSCIALRHPGGSTGYRIEADGKVFVFATDVEVTGDEILAMQKQDAAFFNGADLLVMDAQYTLEESFNKFDWGHTTPSICVNFATAFKIHRLVLTHHEPSYDDYTLGHNLHEAVGMAKDLGNDRLEVFLAREDDEYTV